MADVDKDNKGDNDVLDHKDQNDGWRGDADGDEKKKSVFYLLVQFSYDV